MPQAQPAAASRPSLAIALAGDAIVTRPLSKAADPESAALFDLLRGADAAAANLETLFHDFGSPAVPAMPALRSDPALARELAWAGFDLVARANNHAGDYGAEGLRETARHVAAAGLVAAGAGESLGEARRAAFFRGARGTVALVAATSTFDPAARAGNPRGRIPARPGVSPLRYETTEIVSRDDLEALRRIARALGENPPAEGGRLDFAGRRFAAGERPGAVTEVDRGDLDAIAAEVRQAAARADVTVVSLHGHADAEAGREIPPDYLRDAARAFVDAGADAVFAHGPHVLRGIEIRAGKPIFYGLGNFAFEYEGVAELPADDYEAVGLPPGAKPADFFDRYDGGGARGHPADPAVWESVVAVARYAGKRLTAVELHPITLGFRRPRAERGTPRLAAAGDARRILERLARLSEPFGTRIEIAGTVGRVALPK